MTTHSPSDVPPREPRNRYGEQDENGVDLSLIRALLRLSPTERVRRADRARRDALRLLEYGRRNRQERP
jgi:hypothetical protein